MCEFFRAGLTWWASWGERCKCDDLKKVSEEITHAGDAKDAERFFEKDGTSDGTDA
jgi:hypothetical protein